MGSVSVGRWLPPVARALLAHVLALLLVVLLQAALVKAAGQGVGFDILLLGEGLLAAWFGVRLGLARWWIPIQLLLLPALVGAARLALPPVLWLVAFVFVLALFWNALHERAPLYLSGRKAWHALAAQVPRPDARLADLGCGFGGALVHLAKAWPAARCEGIESAPLAFAIAWLRALARPGMQVRFGSFWAIDLAPYDLVFAYLSPQPMVALWLKVRAEMRPGSVFVSHSFPVPEVPPGACVEFEPGRFLYVYRL